MKKVCLIVLALLLFSGVIFAQSITGVVKDKKTGEGLPFAIVRVVGTSEGTVCNQEGVFQLEVKGSEAYSLEARFVGYTSVLRKGKAGARLIFELDANPTLLNEITVTEESQTAFELLQDALSRLPENYHSEALRAKAFYREFMQVDIESLEKRDIDKKYEPTSSRKIAEALLKSYVPGHTKKELKAMPEFSLINGRNIEIQNKTDSRLDSTLNEAVKNFKLKEGPEALDFANLKKMRKSDFLTNESLYNYEVAGLIEFNGRKMYHVKITPKPSKKLLLVGKIYIDEETLGIAYLESRYSPAHIHNAMSLKLLGIEVKDLQEVNRFIYDFSENGWYLKYVAVSSTLAVNIDKKNIGARNRKYI